MNAMNIGEESAKNDSNNFLRADGNWIDADAHEGSSCGKR